MSFTLKITIRPSLEKKGRVVADVHLTLGEDDKVYRVHQESLYCDCSLKDFIKSIANEPIIQETIS